MSISPSQVHIDKALSNISIYYKNPSYVADALSPIVSVAKESDRYYVYGKENFTIAPSLREDKSETKQLSRSLSNEPYLCREYGYHSLISDRERANADAALNMDIDETEFLTDCLLLDREYRVANEVLDNTNTEWSGYASTHFRNMAQSWSNVATADPRQDINAGKYVIFRDSRRKANTIFIPTETAMILGQMDQIDELRKYTDPNLVLDSGIPPKLFGLRVFECESTYNQAAAGESEDMVETWGNNCIIAFINPQGMGLKTLTFALSFQNRPFQTEKWREFRKNSDAIQVTHMYDSKMVAPACGYVLANCNGNIEDL
jgi:hypothetical protein